MSLIFSNELTAQVIIKEKVEINPLKKFNFNSPTNFPDTAAVKSSNGISFNKLQNKLDNTQSTIFLPEGGKVTAQIILSDAAASSKIDLIQRQPEQQTIIEYANHEVGYSWTSPGYPPGSNLEFGIYWYWNYYGTIYEGNEAGSKITQIGENEYEIGFEAAGDDWDYNELVINVTIETYELLINIEPPTISTGQTAQITVKKQFYDGSIQEFPEGQLFEVGMMEGCAAGALVSAGDTAAYFNGVTQPILFVAADSLENDQETVKIGVGLVEGISGGEIINSKIADSDFNIQKMKKEFLDNNPESINALLIVGNCFGQNFNSKILGYGTFVVKKGECDEEIIVCNNPQPQTFNPLWIEKYKNYSYFDPEPKNPLSLNYIVSGCQFKRNSNVQGLTFIIPGIPLSKTANQNYSWRPQDNAIIKVCLDENEKRWLIRFEELRIPIFSSDCIEGLVDLGNGSNISLLESNITSMKDYRIVIDDIKSWRNQYPVDPKKYAFNSGIIKHEYKHYLIDSIYVINSFNNLFNNIFNSNEWFLDKNTFTCPKEVLSAKEFLLRDNIIQVVNNCFTRYKNLSETEKEQEEMECVKFAQDEYDLIKIRIQGWAVNQPWFKP